MDFCSCLGLVDTPTLSEIKYKLCFDTETDMIASLKHVEYAYWDYIDNYYGVSPSKYRYFKITQFLEHILGQCYPDLQEHAFNMIRTYSKYKKALATDGVILYTYDRGLYLLLVRVTGSKLWSMPKGKREIREDSLACAVREFKEETGLDISDSVNSNMKSVAIIKTNFYILEADHMLTVNYQSNEITGVRWIPVKEILAKPDNFSKQAYHVGRYLVDGALKD
jgi:8-oxo-dGTP pyrophosphatase MutT (NUDIX family)